MEWGEEEEMGIENLEEESWVIFKGDIWICLKVVEKDIVVGEFSMFKVDLGC